MVAMNFDTNIYSSWTMYPPNFGDHLIFLACSNSPTTCRLIYDSLSVNVPRLSPVVSWDRFQPPVTLIRMNDYGKWMIGVAMNRFI